MSIKLSKFTAIVSVFASTLLFSGTFAQPLDKRIDTLLQQMSMQEKIDQLINDGFMTTPTNSRLKIPGFVMNDGPHGVRQPDHGTAFPTGIAMAATWDKSIAFQSGVAMGKEFWAHGRHQQLGPCIDLAQDPRAGRNAETGGEDPYLCGQIGMYVTRGIQTTPVIATVKHFMVEGKQAYRHERNEIFTDRWASEHYGYNFRTVVQDGAAMSVMVSYNLINGVQASESKYLLDTLLRQRWGFPFYVVSDWAAVHENRSEQSITAGTDLCMGNDAYKWELPGNVPESIIDKAVRNILRTKIIAGMLDNYPRGDLSVANSLAHREISLEGARKSIILLKNSDKILPVSKSIGKIALIGPNADKANLNCFGSSETDPVDPVSLKDGLEEKLGAANVLHTYGCEINSTSEADFERAKNLAKEAAVVIFAGGLDDTQEGEAYNSGSDRVNESSVLPGKQQDLINALAEVNPNIIVVIQSGGVCSMNRSLPNMKGLIYSFYAGHDAGTAIADVIFGDYNPAGRMPVTMPVDDAQLPEWNDDFTDDFGCGYRWFDEKGIEPQFPFGFGLSYTTFEYSNMDLSLNTAPAGSAIQVNVDVQNTGLIDGEEVVQLYISNIGSSLWMPKKELKGFERIKLAAGEKKTVTFNLTSEEFYYWNETSKSYDVNPGDYIIRVGGSSANLPLCDTLTYTESAGKPDLKITEIFTVPRYPKKGDQVYVYAMVKNMGNAALRSSDKFKISFSLNDSVVTQSLPEVEIKTGQATLIESIGSFKAPSDKFSLMATVDSERSIEEWLESNNIYIKQVGIPGPRPDLSKVNVALNQPVTASSSKNGSNPALVVDGNMNSRWESEWEDNQWICVDLGTTSEISKVILSWEAAYASKYTLQVSEDSISWTDISSNENSDGDKDTITFDPVNARFVRINCITRATEYGFSIYEIEVYPAPVAVFYNKNRKRSQPIEIHQSRLGYVKIKGISGVNQIIINDLQGRSIFKGNLRAGITTTIYTRNFRNGVYILNCIGPDTRIKQKLLISH